MINIHTQEYIKTLSIREMEELLSLVKFRLAQEKFKLQGKTDKEIKENIVYGQKNDE